MRLGIFTTIAFFATTSSVLAQDTSFTQDSLKNVITEDSAENFAREEKSYSPYPGRNYPTRPLWGDTHVHTALSTDAFGAGARLDAEDAYRFARGEEVRMVSGMRVKLSRPLDWIVVADHAEGLGMMYELYKGNSDLLADDERNRRWYGLLREGGDSAWQAVIEIVDALGEGNLPQSWFNPDLAKSVWESHVEITDRYNDPGTFTAFNGYEFTSMPDGNNMHRVVIYRDDADKAGSMLPFSSFDSEDPEDLWDAMERYEAETGGSVLALAHNGNLSDGLMFDTNPFSGKPMSRQYAEQRARWESMYEVTQIKGDGEAHPMLSPDDEFADYETWDKANLGMTKINDGDPEKMAGMYARSGLKRGLAIEEEFGANPFKFGMVGSSDTHISLPAIEEDNFLGKYENTAPNPERWSDVGMRSSDGSIKILGWEDAASGYAAVWAHENTRESIFDAMRRKEVYATTGPRMTVRFFGGWDFVAEDAETRMPANKGYDKGVPMGGDLYDAPDGKAPSFLVAALRDPFSGNLDRIQIIKGWLDSSGETQEKVFDVVWSGDRQPGADGKLPPVGNTVNPETATWSNSIGSPELIKVWTDPDFDPSERAFYYARVLEVPTPRWTTYDAARYNIELAPEVPRSTQERAYTSPIWYTPSR